MKKFMVIAFLLSMCMGCSSDPDLTPEQRRALQALGEMQDPEGIELDKRFGACIDKLYEMPKTNTDVGHQLRMEYIRREEADGKKAAIEWFEKEVKKPEDELFDTWARDWQKKQRETAEQE